MCLEFPDCHFILFLRHAKAKIKTSHFEPKSRNNINLSVDKIYRYSNRETKYFTNDSLDCCR